MSPVQRTKPALSRSFYAHRSAVLATMHRKEKAIAPALMRMLGLRIIAAAGLDTDQLGTFTGEIPRQGTMLEVAIRKARLGMAALGLPLGLASEGSFGPNPAMPFFPAGMELLAFVDDKRGIVVHESLIAVETNFAHLVISPGETFDPFLSQVGFPRHAVIVRANQGEMGAGLAKGIANREQLVQAICDAAAVSADGKARIETDMRAHFNPTRMKSLGALAKRLARRLATACPACGSPGFGGAGARPGLACEDCGARTEMAAAEIFQCVRCENREERPRADGLRAAPARLCPQCNP